MAALGLAPDIAESAETATPPTAYVDKNSVGGRCDDARSFSAARSPSTPWCSPAKAIAAAPAGSTVYLRRAAYADFKTPAQVVRSGYTTLRPYAGEESQVTIAGAILAKTSYLKLDGLTLTQTLSIDHGSHHVTVSRAKTKNVIIQDGVTDVLIEDSALTMTSGTSGVIFLSSSTTEPEIQRVTIRRNVISGGHVSINARHFRTVVIEDNELKNVSRYGTTQHSDVIRTYAGGTGLTVRRNRLHDNEGNGFFIKDGKVYDVTLENNEITDTIGTGFKASLIYDVAGLRIVNNTFWGSFTLSGTATGVTLANNVLGYFNELGKTTYTYKDYNIVGAGIHGPLAPHEIKGRPTFVNPAGRDYRLAAGSLGIDAGTSHMNGALAPTSDRLARGRTDDPAMSNTGGGLTPYYDIGALER